MCLSRCRTPTWLCLVADGSYLTYGYLQESIYKVDEHDGTRFTFTSSLLALQCFINMLMGILAYTIWSLAVNEEEEGEEKLQKRPNGKDEKLSSMFSWKAQFGKSNCSYTS